MQFVNGEKKQLEQLYSSVSYYSSSSSLSHSLSPFLNNTDNINEIQPLNVSNRLNKKNKNKNFEIMLKSSKSNTNEVEEEDEEKQNNISLLHFRKHKTFHLNQEKHKEKRKLKRTENLLTFFEICFSSDLFYILTNLCKTINEICIYVRSKEWNVCQIVVERVTNNVKDILQFYENEGNACLFESTTRDLFHIFQKHLNNIIYIINRSKQKNKMLEILREIENLKNVVKFIIFSFFNFHLSTFFRKKKKKSQVNINSAQNNLQKHKESFSDDSDKFEFSDDVSGTCEERQNSLSQLQSLRFRMNHKERHMKVNKYNSRENVPMGHRKWDEWEKWENCFNTNELLIFPFEDNVENNNLRKVTTKLLEFNYNSHIIPHIISNYLDQIMIQKGKEEEEENEKIKNNTWETEPTEDTEDTENTQEFQMTSTEKAILVDKENYAHFVFKKINEHIKLSTFSVNSNEFLNYFEEDDLFKKKLANDFFFKKNHFLNIDTVHKHLSMLFKVNIGVYCEDAYYQFLTHLNKLLLAVYTCNSSDVRGSLMDLDLFDQTNKHIGRTGLNKRNTFYFMKKNRLSSSIFPILQNRHNESKTYNLNFPLLRTDNKFLSILFHMWQQIEVNFFSKLVLSDHMSNIPRNCKSLSTSLFLERSETRRGNREQWRKRTSEIMHRTNSALGNNTNVFKWGQDQINEQLDYDNKDISINGYLKMMIYDLFNCKNDEKQIDIQEFMNIFQYLKIPLKTSIIHKIWSIILGQKNINLALKGRITVSNFIKRAYTTNPSLIFYEYCKTKIELKEAKKNIKMLQQYNKRIQLLVRD